MEIDEIKSLMRSGDIAGAEAAVQELLTTEPDNVRAMILYGTCRQLLGDEATFRDTYATVKAALDVNEVELDTVTAEEWKLFEKLHRNLDLPELLRKGDQPCSPIMMEYVILAVLIVAAIIGVWIIFGDEIRGQFDAASSAIISVRSLYAGPPRDHLYAGPQRDDLMKGAATTTNKFGADE